MKHWFSCVNDLQNYSHCLSQEEKIAKRRAELMAERGDAAAKAEVHPVIVTTASGEQSFPVSH